LAKQFKCKVLFERNQKKNKGRFKEGGKKKTKTNKPGPELMRRERG